MTGPMRTRTSRSTGCPTASSIRRTWRLRPSWMVMRTRPGSGWLAWAGAVRPVVELDAVAQPAQRARAQRSGHLGQVLLLDAEARMGEAVGQLAVVGEEQQALRVGVEPAHGEHPRLGGHEVDHGRAAVGVLGRRDDAGGLVEQVVDQARACTETDVAVDLDVVVVDLDPPAETGQLRR